MQEVEKVRGKRRIQTVITLMAVLFCLSALFGSKTARAATEGAQAEIISLHRKNPDENLVFQETNMLPGDSVTRYYRVKVSYAGTINVYFQA